MLREDRRGVVRLSLEVSAANDEPGAAEAILHLNHEGLEILRQALARLVEGEAEPVIHLLSDAWGGTHLTEERARPENLIVHHLKIVRRPWRDDLPAALRPS